MEYEVINNDSTFKFKKIYHDAIKECDPKSQEILYNAVMRYGLTGEDTKITGNINAVYLLIKQMIDYEKFNEFESALESEED